MLLPFKGVNVYVTPFICTVNPKAIYSLSTLQISLRYLEHTTHLYLREQCKHSIQSLNGNIFHIHFADFTALSRKNRLVQMSGMFALLFKVQMSGMFALLFVGFFYDFGFTVQINGIFALLFEVQKKSMLALLFVESFHELGLRVQWPLYTFHVHLERLCVHLKWQQCTGGCGP